jgi:hypothetical protein
MKSLSSLCTERSGISFRFTGYLETLGRHPAFLTLEFLYFFRASAEKLATLWMKDLLCSSDSTIGDVESWMKKCVLENLLGSGFGMPTDIMGTDNNPLLHVSFRRCMGVCMF